MTKTERLAAIRAHFAPPPARRAPRRMAPRDPSLLRRRIEAALREVPRRSDRAIARVLGCDNTSVSAVRRSLGIPAGPRDRTKRDRNAALVEMARAGRAEGGTPDDQAA